MRTKVDGLGVHSFQGDTGLEVLGDFVVNGRKLAEELHELQNTVALLNEQLKMLTEMAGKPSSKSEQEVSADVVAVPTPAVSVRQAQVVGLNIPEADSLTAVAEATTPAAMTTPAVSSAASKSKSSKAR